MQITMCERESTKHHPGNPSNDWHCKITREITCLCDTQAPPHILTNHMQLKAQTKELGKINKEAAPKSKKGSFAIDQLSKNRVGNSLYT